MKQVDGIWWPEHDRHCHKVVPGQVKDLERAIPLCKDLQCAVQAGGNVGIWASYLATQFDRVWTFEPDLENFNCLKLNVTESRVNAIHAGLGAHIGYAALELASNEQNNVGAYQTCAGADFIVTTIDSLKLPVCDLIALDTEGTEPLILEGARKTIEAHKPVLMIEDKGLSERYGAPQGWTDAIDGYVVVDRVHRDVVLAPE